MKKIIKFIKILIIILLVQILIYVTYLRYIKKEEVISIFNKSFLIVTTGSMEPTIKGKELIIIDKKENYEIGDIVTYKDKKNFIVTHRIINIDGKYFIAKGDKNNIDDGIQEMNRIYGKVIYHSKILGIIILYVIKPVLLIYMLYIIISELYFLKKESKNEKQTN